LTTARIELFYRCQHDDCHPQRHPNLLLDCHALARPAASAHATAVCPWVCLYLRGGWFDGGHAGVRALGPAGARHVFCGGSLALCVDWGGGLPAVWRHLLLVSQNHRSSAERAGGQMELLADVHWFQSDLLPHARAWAAG